MCRDHEGAPSCFKLLQRSIIIFILEHPPSSSYTIFTSSTDISFFLGFLGFSLYYFDLNIDKSKERKVFSYQLSLANFLGQHPACKLVTWSWDWLLETQSNSCHYNLGELVYLTWPDRPVKCDCWFLVIWSQSLG